MKMGFTGTQTGITNNQRAGISFIIGAHNDMHEFHHGICIGADEAAHELIRILLPDVKIVGHPPTNESKMADLIVDTRREPRPYLTRNHDIANETDKLIVCPRGMVVIERSGTWATYRYAKKLNKPTITIWPTGDMEIKDN